MWSRVGFSFSKVLLFTLRYERTHTYQPVCAYLDGHDFTQHIIHQCIICVKHGCACVWKHFVWIGTFLPFSLLKFVYILHLFQWLYFLEYVYEIWSIHIIHRVVYILKNQSLYIWGVFILFYFWFLFNLFLFISCFLMPFSFFSVFFVLSFGWIFFITNFVIFK